jgi:iron complex transport system ATP-binding protein
VIMMRDGRIFADGAKGDLLTPEKIRELFGVEVTMVEHDGSLHCW